MNNYPTYRYDDNFVLKMSPLLKAITLYALRHFVLVLLAYNPSRTMGSLIYLRHQIDPLLLLSDLPALVLVYAWIKRSAGASEMVKVLWHKGRELLITSAGLHLALMLWLSGGEVLSDSLGEGFPVFLQGLIDIVVLQYLYRSRLVKDVFADFPGRSEK